MIYEIRVYRCLPGRLPALLKRFETTTLKLWDKHGIRPAGFFTTLEWTLPSPPPFHQFERLPRIK